MELSSFGHRFTSRSGILRLMDDLGTALAGDRGVLMLGGGNPSHIPEIHSLFRARMRQILDTPGEFECLIGNYEPPKGDERFIAAVAALLRREYGWRVGPENVALTPGSQAGFFMLFNALAGAFDTGANKKILLPMAPEYIGYTDLGLARNFFVAKRPTIEMLDRHIFKYRVNFDDLEIADDIAAICVSRPTNPTGNVLTDAELVRLAELARSHGIPLIIDSAYGTPFPNIIFTDARPLWDRSTVLFMSLSKIGLPGARTAIVIAREELIDAVANANAIVNLSNGSLGPALARDLVETGEITRVSRDIIRPYYETRARQTMAWFAAALDGCNYCIHKPEGAIFLWLWFPDLPITGEELYLRLKRRGVLVISGHYFFPGLAEEWRHQHECIRVTYSQDPETVARGVEIIADEVKKAYAGVS